ncbi:MAG: molybdopterin-dependent oxidoreductase [Dehalococcoidia bacterium]|nr:MAG: molybdopterin-dependent oxidoreductase [Dehalococcoidia bacterium]
MRDELLSKENIVMTAHCSHCGGTCLLKVHVKDGVITRIETDDGEEPQYRACAKGRAYRQRVYAPDRLKYPMKRVGARGEGKFERISWDEALDIVARELSRVRETYGAESILFKSSSGDIGRIHGAQAHFRILCMVGGCSEVWGIPSYEGAVFEQIATFGTASTTSSRDDLLNSRLIIMWGWNPADTVMLTNTMWYLVQAREAGINIVSVDPRYTNTAAVCANQWIPIRPGTDTAMLIAMSYVIINQDLQDQEFLDTYTVGFDKYREYVMGIDDGLPKTPQWAAAITGVTEETIESLAREYATVKPAALMAGIGPGRTAYGEQYHRAAATLAAMTGNIGIHGGDAGASAYTGMMTRYPFMEMGRGIPTPINPVESKAPPRKNSFLFWDGVNSRRSGNVHLTKVADAILKGKAGGYPADYRLLYIVNNNYPNQYLNINKCVDALTSKPLEFIVVFEQFMTSAAKFADILLPVNTCLERNDITTGATLGFYGFMGKAIESIGESKSHLEICAELALRLGIKDYDNKTEDELLRQIASGSTDITDYEAFKKAGGHKIRRNEPYVAFKQQIEDPENNPFPTPSGKIEIYCQRLADMKNPLIPPIPKYIETWEGLSDPLVQKYPLQLITTHFWRRAHSQYDNIPWLRELEPQRVLINSVDAGDRNIRNGDLVKVFNDRGITILPARVTERIMPGVVDIPQGAWYHPDENGVDRGGSANVLTKDEHSPGGAYPTNTSLVQVEKVELDLRE